MNKIKLTPCKFLYNVILSSITFMLFFTYTFSKIANSKTFEDSPTLTKEEVFKLIKAQSKESYNNIDNLDYAFAYLDEDDDLELVAKMHGGVHLGYFYVFDKDKNGNYKLVAERGWKVDKWDLDNIDIVANLKIYEMMTVEGGSGLDIHTARLWYIKDGKFHEAWEGQLYLSSAFHFEIYLQMGGYKFNNYDEKIYYWSSEYNKNWETNKVTKELSTTSSIYKFDGTKFILKSKNKCK